MKREKSTSAAGLYWFLFVRAAVPFGIVMGLYIGLKVFAKRGSLLYALLATIIAGLLSGAVFGALMSLIIGTLGRVHARRAGVDVLDVHQRRTVAVAGARRAVMARVEEALARLPSAKQVEVDEEAGTVEVRTRMSWRSFGEVVSARLEITSEDGCTVHVESRPKREPTLIDYGANARNVDAVVATLDGRGTDTT